jgi:putative aldouronate transport system permease protein
MGTSLGEKWFNRINAIALLMIAALCVFPFLNAFAQSFSSHRAIISGSVWLWPVEFNIRAYQKVFEDHTFYKALYISVLRTAVGATLGVLVAAMLAYPLARPQIKGRSTILFLILFTMLFSGGMIPTYLVVKSLGLLNSFWGLIFPGLTGAFHIIVMKSFFQSIPAELEDSARVDGCSPFGVFFRIILPLSLPMLAAIFLFKAVGHWNAFFDAILYITDRSMYLSMLDQMTKDFMIEDVEKTVPTESLKAATLMTSMLPILLVYPFLQKYFVKGMMLGSVKG